MKQVEVAVDALNSILQNTEKFCHTAQQMGRQITVLSCTHAHVGGKVETGITFDRWMRTFCVRPPRLRQVSPSGPSSSSGGRNFLIKRGLRQANMRRVGPETRR